jgi:hypothetical protein
MMRSWRRLAMVALPVLLGLSGCNTYKYFDVHVTFDATTGNFDTNQAGTVSNCRVTVSGADSFVFELAPGSCPNRTGGNLLDAGIFEFSTFADSGNLKFDVDAFQANKENPDCQIGNGSTTIPVSSAMTIAGSVLIERHNAMGIPFTGCQPATP